MVHVLNPFNTQKWSVDNKENSKIRRSFTIKFKVALGVAIILTLLIIAVIVVCFILPKHDKTSRNWLPMYESHSSLGIYKNAAVSTDAAPCAVIGKDILAKNGSAVDAAIAVLLCMGVVNPQSMGLGGGFLMLYYEKEKDTTHYIDAREVAPEAATEDMFQGNATVAKIGGLSIAVPGELAGYVSAHDQFGSLKWEELFPPTIKMCEEGIEVNAHLAKSLRKYKDEIMSREHMRNVFVNNATGNLLQVGDIYKRLDLAETLRIISKEKGAALYGTPSEITNKFLKDLKDAGSIITMKDLESYIPEMKEAIKIKIRNNMTLYSASLPGSGPILALILNVLDGYEDFQSNTTKSKNETIQVLHRMVETFKFAYAKRMHLEDDDSDEMNDFIKMLADRDYADDIRLKIDDNHTHDPDYYGLNITLQNDHGTAHLSIIAPNGDAVSVTSTVNQYFGSHVMSPSTGILLNDEMDDFSSPNITNYFGVPPTGKNHIRPGKRPFSSMCPTIIVDENRNVRLAVGGNGGTQITTSVAQVIIRSMWLGNNIKEAIDAPRFHHQLLPNYIEHELNYPKDILEELEKKGHDLHKLGENMLGIIMGITRDDNGTLYANSDYRKGGAVDGF